MPSNLGVSNEPGRLVEEAGVPDLEPPPRPLEGGNLPPFLGVYIRSEMHTSCTMYSVHDVTLGQCHTDMKHTGALGLTRIFELQLRAAGDLPRHRHQQRL